MREPKALSLPSSSPPLSASPAAGLRLHDLSRAVAAGQRRPLHCRARPAHIRGGAHSRRRLPRPAGRVLRPDHAAALHDARVAQLEAAFGRHGLGNGSRVVLYSIGTMMWATRFWWMLQSLGFDGAAVLDGGFDKWQAEGRPTESGPAQGYPPATFKASPAPGFFVDKRAVLAAHRGSGHRRSSTRSGRSSTGAWSPAVRPARAGSRAASTSRRRPWSTPPTKDFTALADAAGKFAAQGVTKDKSVICYCGGGISATIDLFLLHQLGYDELDALRRLDGRVGEGPVAAHRDGLRGNSMDGRHPPAA